MSEVVFKNVCKVYSRGDSAAVDDFNLEIRDGEFLVLVGPSGCGKSTTLRMVAGLELPTAGAITIGGRDVTNLPPKDRDIAMVFQNYALYPHLTVKENMSFALKLRKFPKDEIERRVNSAADALGLAPYMKRLPKALSGGQRQRVALGRAIVREPSVFLFDEPLSNLDAKMRVEMRAEIIRLHQRLKATMIYVTHDQTEAMTMGERIVVMNAGRIQQVAPPLEVYENPANPFVAGFIGTPPMNLLPSGTFGLQGTVGIRPEHLHLERIEGAADNAGRGKSAAQSCAATGQPGATAAANNAGRGKSAAQSPEAVVDFLEPLGSETLVHLVLAGERQNAPINVIARVPGFSALKAGERVRLVPDMARVRIFEGEKLS